MYAIVAYAYQMWHLQIALIAQNTIWFLELDELDSTTRQTEYVMYDVSVNQPNNASHVI